jgi:hypothetical protein
MREVDMGNDRDLFTEEGDGLPVFEGRMVDLYDYRAKGYSSGRGRAAVWPDLPFGDPRKAILPQWRIPEDRIPDKLIGRINLYRIGFCDVASPTNERSLIAALIPPNTICGDKVPTVVFERGGPADMLLWLSVANSLTMDFIVRKKVALKMSYTIMDSLPFPRDRRRTTGAEAIIARAFALSAVGPEMEDFRRSASNSPGVPQGVSPAENQEIRAHLMAEIDALVAHEVFGLTRDELRYVLDPITCSEREVALKLSKRSAIARSGSSVNIGHSGSCWRRGTASSTMAHSAVVRADIDPAAPPEARSDLLVRELRSLYRRDLGFATSTAMIGPCLSATFRHPGQSGNWIAALW